MTHTMNLQTIYFEKIKNGTKIFEIRLNDEKRQKIKIGDCIIFANLADNSQTFKVVVEDLLHFNSFKQMTRSLPLKQVGFDGLTVSEVEKIYHEFYSTENEKQYGVLAIKVKLK